MKVFFKFFALLFAILFLWSAYVQYNDPDPYLWYAIYGVAAVASVAFVFDKLHFLMAVGLMVCYLIGGILSWPVKFEGVTIGQGDIKNIEEGREALGLFFCTAIMLVYALRMRFLSKQKAKMH